tara:strand:+ start:10123 stop:10467 length:345 start_codon:yes stop_codon:yes gene_type:complete
MSPAYNYRADFLEYLSNGDIAFLVDLGFETYRKVTVSMIEACPYSEANGSSHTISLGAMAREYVEGKLSKAKSIVIDVENCGDKYSARIYYGMNGGALHNLARELLDMGLATAN